MRATCPKPLQLLLAAALTCESISTLLLEQPTPALAFGRQPEHEPQHIYGPLRESPHAFHSTPGLPVSSLQSLFIMDLLNSIQEA